MERLAGTLADARGSVPLFPDPSRFRLRAIELEKKRRTAMKTNLLLATLSTASPAQVAALGRFHISRRRSFPANFSRNFRTFGATTNEQYACCGLFRKYSW